MMYLLLLLLPLDLLISTSSSMQYSQRWGPTWQLTKLALSAPWEDAWHWSVFKSLCHLWQKEGAFLAKGDSNFLGAHIQEKRLTKNADLTCWFICFIYFTIFCSFILVFVLLASFLALLLCLELWFVPWYLNTTCLQRPLHHLFTCWTWCIFYVCACLHVRMIIPLLFDHCWNF